LRHLLVVEEAHRLLSRAVGVRRPEEGDPRGKAVETFGHLLAELRAYGQGVLVPTRSLRSCFPTSSRTPPEDQPPETVAADDRMALGGAMAMSERQAHSLAALPVGRRWSSARATTPDCS
jgi:hypothetical protein